MSTGHTQIAPITRLFTMQAPPPHPHLTPTYPQCLWFVGEVHRITAPGVATQPARHQELETECGLDHQKAIPPHNPSRFLVEEMDLNLSGKEMHALALRPAPYPASRN